MTSNTSSIKKSAQTVLAPIAEDLKAVNDILAREFAHSQSPTITEIGSYITQAGGKRMRPALLMLMARALGYEGTDHRELGATIEMLHTATLMHDDVVDEGKMRRAKEGTGARNFYEVCERNERLDDKAQLRPETLQYVPRFVAISKIMRNRFLLALKPFRKNCSVTVLTKVSPHVVANSS